MELKTEIGGNISVISNRVNHTLEPLNLNLANA